ASGPLRAPGRPWLRCTPASQAKPVRTTPLPGPSGRGCMTWCQRSPAWPSAASVRPFHCVMSARVCMAKPVLFDHGKLQAEALGAVDGGLVAGVGMAHHARSAIVDQHALQPLGGRIAAIRDDDHAGVLRI